MEAVRRVVIRDRYPILGPEVIQRPLNRLVIGAAAAALAGQVVALIQVLRGRGTASGIAGHTAGASDHVAFAGVALVWLAMGILVFLQRRAHEAGQFFLLAAAVGSVFLSFGTLYGAGIADALVFAGSLLLLPACLLEFTRVANQVR